MSESIPSRMPLSDKSNLLRRDIDALADSTKLKALQQGVDQCRRCLPKPGAGKPIRHPSHVPPLPGSIEKLVHQDAKVRDKLLRTYSSALPRPGGKEGKQEVAILWRGCRADQLVSMVAAGSAGGERVNVHAVAPGESEAIQQVGEKQSLPEFTFDTRIAERFGKGTFIVACEIESKYLSMGSVAEQGVVCTPDAPITIVGWKFGPPIYGAR